MQENLKKKHESNIAEITRKEQIDKEQLLKLYQEAKIDLDCKSKKIIILEKDNKQYQD